MSDAADRPAAASPESAPGIIPVDLDWRSVVVLLALFCGLVAFRGLVHETPRTLTWMALAVLLALALNPIIDAVQNRVRCRRAPAVAIVVAGLTLLLSLLAMLLAPPAIRQARHLSRDAPRVTRQLGDLPFVGKRLRENDVPAKVERWIKDAPDKLTVKGVGKVTKRLADTVLGFTVTIMLAICLMLDGPRLLGNARRLVPLRWLPRTERAADLAYRTVGRYVAGSLLVAAIAGLGVLVVGLALGVPLSPLLAVWVALFDLIPQIGGAAGGVPFVALALTKSATTGVICAVYFILYLQFENHILSPLIVGRAVSLSPPATMIAALVGVSVAGVVGGLFAVPLVGAAKAVYVQLRADATPATA